MSDAASTPAINVVLEPAEGAALFQDTVTLPEGCEPDDALCVLLEAADLVARRAGYTAATVRNLLKAHGGLFYDAGEFGTRLDLLGGPASLGKIMNGGLSDTKQRFSEVPVGMMVAALQHWLEQLGEDRSGYDREARVAATWFSFMQLKGWVYHALRHGSYLFGKSQYEELLNGVASILEEGLVALELQELPQWFVGDYDQKVGDASTRVLVSLLRQKTANALDPSKRSLMR